MSRWHVASKLGNQVEQGFASYDRVMIDDFPLSNIQSCNRIGEVKGR